MRELSLNVMDIAQNSITAKASLITLTVEESAQKDRLCITIEDNGRGMTPEQVSSVTDPFFTSRTTRSVGLGIPLFKLAAEQTGGGLEIFSKQGEGTTVRAEFVMSSVDMTPLGDINSTVSILIRCNPQIDFVFAHTTDKGRMELDTRQLREILGGDVPLDNGDVIKWIEDYLAEQTSLIN